MASIKTVVVEYLFNKHWDESTGALRKTVMTLDDVAEAIRACNAADGLERSANNPANFLKDIVRSRNASKIWPTRLSALRISGAQRTGTGDSFAFVDFGPDQAEAFPDLFRPNSRTTEVDLQSVSMPRESKSLGRSDEAWLIQTAVNLRVIEQHMATVSTLDVQEITHLQMTVKLRATEIDAIYSASIGQGKSAQKAIITCEAKKHSERILEDQIISQVIAAFGTTDATLVVPVAIRSVKNKGIHVVEFEAVSRSELGNFKALALSRDALYKLVPPVKGI
jgi:hypothetical protein